MPVHVPRTVTAIAFTTTLSLLATILSLATVNAMQLRWDGSFCARSECTVSGIASAQGRSAKPQQARMAAAPARTL